MIFVGKIRILAVKRYGQICPQPSRSNSMVLRNEQTALIYSRVNRRFICADSIDI